jgi:hypothetical protein
MIVFLLLMIVAILLLGVGAITGAITALSRIALLMIVIAVGLGLAQKVPAWCWIALVATLVIGATSLIAWLGSESANTTLANRPTRLDERLSQLGGNPGAEGARNKHIGTGE